MNCNVSTISILTFLIATTPSFAQSDFFWSFDASGNTGATTEINVGDTKTAFLYYTTNGPSDADIDTAMFLDIYTETPGVIRFIDAYMFDAQVEVTNSLGGCLEYLGNRWGSVFGQTGNVSDYLIDELHASNVGFPFSSFGATDQTACVGGICECGSYSYLPEIDAFPIGYVEFEAIGEGFADISMVAGDGGLINDGQNISVQFGQAEINVTSMVLLGDVNLDGFVDLLDVAPFVDLLTKGGFQAEADINQDGAVDLLDVAPFVDLLSGG